MSEKNRKKGWKHLLPVLQNGKMIKVSPGELQLQNAKPSSSQQCMEFSLSCDLTVLRHTGWLVVLLMDISYYCGDNATDNMKLNLSVTAILTAWSLSGLFSKFGKGAGLEGWR